MNRSIQSFFTIAFFSAGLVFFNEAKAQDQQEQNASTEISRELGQQESTPISTTEAPLDRTKLSYSNKWRVKFDNEAKSAGTLVFRLVMKDTKVAPITVTIPIKKGTNENNTADVVEDAMQKAFPRDFNVETDDGESVLVKLNLIEGSSSLVLLSNDVKNLKIKIKKE
jgi:hypothetical protein